MALSVFGCDLVTTKTIKNYRKAIKHNQQSITNQSQINKNETVGVLGCLRDARWLQDHEKGACVLIDFRPLGRPGRSKGGFWYPRGFPKSPKIDMMRIDRHLGGAKWAKKASRRGFRNATENVTKKVSQN